MEVCIKLRFVETQLVRARLQGLYRALSWPISGSDNGASWCVYHAMGTNCSPEKGDHKGDEEQGRRRDGCRREVLQLVRERDEEVCFIALGCQELLFVI